jgi:hypothetical protein
MHLRPSDLAEMTPQQLLACVDYIEKSGERG